MGQSARGMNTAPLCRQDSTSAGALGRPYFGKIGAFPAALRGWDPTDPTEGNPWNQYLGAAFNPEEYLALNPDLNGLYPWNPEMLRFHWLTSGIAEGRSGSQAYSIAAYKALHPELVSRLGNDNYAWTLYYNQHPENAGATTVSAPGADDAAFDAVAYADRYPDLKAAFGYDAALLQAHYETFGRAEGRYPGK